MKQNRNEDNETKANVTKSKRRQRAKTPVSLAETKTDLTKSPHFVSKDTSLSWHHQSQSSNKDTSLNSTSKDTSLSCRDKDESNQISPLCYKQEAGKKVASSGKETPRLQRQMQTNKNSGAPNPVKAPRVLLGRERSETFPNSNFQLSDPLLNL